MRRLILFLSMIILLTSCIPESNMAGTLLEGSEISLSWKGVNQVTYNSADYQLGFNDGKNEYRVYDDKLADWFTVTCSQKPVSEGETIIADVSWTGSKGTKSFTEVEFSVEKTDERGYIWLWSNSKKIGIIIKNIQ